ncbi:hypothetical protein PISMIDRAFT_93262 [Pisolithus microcarpus 441]|uniref:Dicer-like protein 1 n=1 Tax=Pisolithus microcarpus 441 TaxID=765257 RepID=A0A0D0A5T0_9AGAM|nr:hypothetical protein PISMIDRAFT_93262 [Pisolithus microcarpus 441]
MEDVQETASTSPVDNVVTRSYQQEMLEASLVENIIVAQDTGSGKTHIAVLRMKIECERQPHKVSWFLAPTVTLCEQQHDVISQAIGSVGLVHGGLEPKQWTDPELWNTVIKNNRVVVSTPQVLLDALSHGYVSLGNQIGLLVFDEAHHAAENHPMNCIMRDHYFSLPVRQPAMTSNHGPVREERPMVLGLTASPMFGGDVAEAFQNLEKNLDSVIRRPRLYLGNLADYVHRPTFRHVVYTQHKQYYTCHLDSPNLQVLKQVAGTMDIELDPYVLALREDLRKRPPGPERQRVDQKLSKVIHKKDSYTHRGLRNLEKTAHDICYDLGPWASDWFVQEAVNHGLQGASPFDGVTSAWQHKEKAYLIQHLSEIKNSLVPPDPETIDSRISDKVKALLRTLADEKTRSESFNEPYSGLIFVTRRDAVLALSGILKCHPLTRDSFTIGTLVGASESSYRTTLLDITRKIVDKSQADTLAEFRSGDINLVVATAVAEEGLDIQACGNVIRWDIPSNMASWVQSRGRARRKRSSFVLMFEAQFDDGRIAEFEDQERSMEEMYNKERRRIAAEMDQLQPGVDSEDVDTVFRVKSTGAVLTLSAAISHLNHFCSLLPTTRHQNYQALYDIDPPDMPEGWHSSVPRQDDILPYPGPFGCTLTLPRVIDAKLRVHVVKRVHLSKRSAFQHVAFQAYVALYRAGLLNDHLLPLMSVKERDLDEDEQSLRALIDKRSGFASVTKQLNPWQPAEVRDSWWSADITVHGLPPLTLFAQVEVPTLNNDTLLNLYHPVKGPLTRLESLGDAVLKFIVGVNLMAQYPLWPEGYLTQRKDQTVNNGRLAKAATKVALYKWIIRTNFTPRKYTPLYLTQPTDVSHMDVSFSEEPVAESEKPKDEAEQLSTKMLADVVESLIGAAYIHGGFDLGIECARLFQLGLDLSGVQDNVERILSRVESSPGFSSRLVDVERMIGYTFQRKLLLVEALTHASYHFDTETVSYERMEFLGDALLDMFVIDFLYHFAGRALTPGDMHCFKSAMVNTYFLAYRCLQLSVEVDASMPMPGRNGRITLQHRTNRIHLYQCLQHSSAVVLDEQRLSFRRFEKNNAEIEEALNVGEVFPWAALTRLQPPKFLSDMIESIIGAVYLDSRGNIETVRTLLRTLGIMDCLERVVREKVDVLHPVSRLGMWASQQQKQIAYDYTEEKGNVVCTITVEGLEPVQAKAEKRGRVSQEEARFAAAEKAIAEWGVGDMWGGSKM